MEIKTLDFMVGAVLGVALGVGGTLLWTRIRGWLGKSEVSRLRSENRVLSRRLAEKDRHISKMLTETQRLAERLGQKKNLLRGEKTEQLKLIEKELNHELKAASIRGEKNG